MAGIQNGTARGRANDAVKTPDDALLLMGERLRAASVAPTIYNYAPHAKQYDFHTSTKQRKLYIGGNRSGKSVGGVVEDLWWSLGEHPYRPDVNEMVRANHGSRGRVVSVDFVNGIEKIIMPLFKQWLPPSKLRDGNWEDSYDKTLRTLYFHNGSYIEFMSYDQDLDKFAGTSRHFTHFDEEPPETVYNECLLRLLDTNGSAWLTMTPVEGMSWVFDRLYEPGRLDNKNIEVIEVDMTENPYLSEQAIDLILEDLSEEEKLARVHGQFVQIGGVIYKQFDPRPGGDHVLPNDVDDEFLDRIKDWFWAVSLDHGYNNPTAALWHAVSPEGKVITFAEHYRAGWTIDQHARYLKEQEQFYGRVPNMYIADPSIKNTDPISGTSILQEYQKFGIPFMLGNNDVKAGINKVQRFMRPLSNSHDGKALWAVAPNCKMLIKELTRYRYKTRQNKKLISENNVFEEPHKKDDHACDSLRYFIMSQPDLEGAGSRFREDTASLGLVNSSQDLGNIGLSAAFGFDYSQALGESEQTPQTWKDPQSENEPSYASGSWEFDEHLGGTW